MVKLFFGLPGSGKTTIMASIAHRELSCPAKLRRYKHVYGNVRMCIPGYTYIDNDCIGRYDLSDALILIDEATLFADSRSYKDFSKDKIAYFLEHRHFNVDIFLFTQQWDGVDRKIRVITDRVYYVFKGKILGLWWTSYYRIPYGIIIPDPKENSQKLGEIIQGYCKPSWFQRLFCGRRVFRPLYYKYFDSFERYHLDPLPETYSAYPERERKKFFKKAD